MPSIVRLLAFPILLALAPAASADPAFETKAVCRTAIAVIMDRDPKLVQATDATDGVVVLTYARPFDNFVLTYRCRLEGNRVIWADEPGRWRDDVKDDKVSFEIVGHRRPPSHHRQTAPMALPSQELFDRDLNEVH